MSALAQKMNGYLDATRSTGNPRDVEYQLFSRITGRLNRASLPGAPFADLAEAEAVRDTLPNADDTVIAPNVAACFGCHNDPVVAGHMELVGAANIRVSRTELLAAPPTQCNICHDTGSGSDAAALHPGLN